MSWLTGGRPVYDAWAGKVSLCCVKIARGRLPAKWLLLAALLSVAPSSHAAFSSFLPLSLGGYIAYSYNYLSANAASERMQLTTAFNAAGYVWQPWFATTSAALNLTFSNTETTTSSFDSSAVTGTFTFSLFPRSRFPFTLVYSRSDSRSASFSDLTQVTGEIYYKVTRLSLRQAYRSRGGSLTNLWYYRNAFSGGVTTASTTAYGLSHQVRSAPNTLTLTANYSLSKSQASDAEPASTVLSLNHIYTPAPSNGVTNLVSYVNADPGAAGLSSTTTTQASSSFYWRPEHRSLSVSGGVRASESEGGTGDSTRRSLDTNVGAHYRLTRRAGVTAGLTVGSTDTGDSQSLTSSQNLGLSYASIRYPLGMGLSWLWQASASAANTSTRTDVQGVTNEQSVQSYGGGISHNFNGSWSLGRASSLSAGFSEGWSGSESSSTDYVSTTLTHSLNFSANRRGHRGSTYGSLQFSDSRTAGAEKSIFQRAGFNLSQELTINRLSGLGGNFSYNINRQIYETEIVEDKKTYRRYATLSFNYRHDRPFGVYNLRFNSRFYGTKDIDSEVATDRMDWENRFQYSLGRLSMSATFRLTKTSSGAPMKSFSFQATRGF